MESGSGIKEKGRGSRERSRDQCNKSSTGKGRASHMGSGVGGWRVSIVLQAMKTNPVPKGWSTVRGKASHQGKRELGPPLRQMQDLKSF